MVKFDKKNFKRSTYAHFDRRLKLDENRLVCDKVYDYIMDNKAVAKHGFYPFIYCEQTSYKYSKNDGLKVKVRPICYSSHLDKCVYQYYAWLLNGKYNDYVNEHNINENSVAYRDNLHKNNIHFAKQAFDFIKLGECDIIIGDFTSFFDNLDHKHLKQMMCKVLGVANLSDDWYAVYKNITRYSTFNIVDILKINNLLTEEELEQLSKPKSNILKQKVAQLNKQPYALTTKQFKENKHCIKPNKTGVGVPQGSSISSVLSNVYMIEFDEMIQKYVADLNGLYIRYSDDFIVVIPKNEQVEFIKVVKFINKCIDDTKKLSIQPEKSKIFHYEEGVITNRKLSEAKVDSIDYLGFVFDGKEVTIRPKTISKYYTRLYRKLRTIVNNNGVTHKGNKISYKNLYRVYTQKGRNGVYGADKDSINKTNKFSDGNFLSYVYKADKIFNSNSDENSHKEPIKRMTNRHMLKIRRQIQKIENS